MKRALSAVAGLAAAVALAGCNETAGGAMAGPSVAAPVAPAAYRLPPGAPCANEINGFQAIVHSDLQTGNVEQRVYDEIEHDLSRAASACSAGKGGEAHAIVSSSKARHGYRA